MAFENVDVASLKSALNTCKNNLNHSTTDSIISNLSSNSWMADSKTNLKKALEKLVNTRYKNLSDKIDEYLTAAGYIQEYKDLDAENDSLEQQIASLNSNLYTTGLKKSVSIDYDGERHISIGKEKIENPEVKRQIDNLTNEIINNNEAMESLKAKVENIVWKEG